MGSDLGQTDGIWGRGSGSGLVDDAPTNPQRPPSPPQDEQSTLQLLQKLLRTAQTVENYADSIAQLSRQCRALLEMGHPQRSEVTPKPPHNVPNVPMGMGHPQRSEVTPQPPP